MSRTLLSLAVALAPLAIAACASSEAAPSKPAAAKASTSSGDFQSLCVETFTHNRTCTDQYIPALVDTRAKIDKPPGIAEKVKQDRAGIIEQAKAEWAEDSTDENIARRCQMMTEHMNAADERVQKLADEARACLPQTDCTAYVACIEPVEEKLMSGPSANP